MRMTQNKHTFKVFDGDPKSDLRLYFVLDLSVLLLENPSSNRLDFGFEFSALGPQAIERLLEEES